jgi:hypothetical protein
LGRLRRGGGRHVGLRPAADAACANGVTAGLSIQQTFLLTTGVWLVLPIFGALPFVFGAIEADGSGARFVDAFFEAMSGLTTTGSTVFTGLDGLPVGINLWRGLLQWFGGIGIIVVAMVFLPELRVGGMQIFRSEAFDTMGKILPRATEIAARISVIYLALTVVCGLTYGALGMPAFDALMHALTTISTGGFSKPRRVLRGLPGTAGIRRGGLHDPREPALRALHPAGRGNRARSCATARCAPISHHPRADRDPGALPGDLQQRPLGTRVPRGDLQRDLDHLGHGLFQRWTTSSGAGCRWSCSSSSG